MLVVGILLRFVVMLILVERALTTTILFSEKLQVSFGEVLMGQKSTKLSTSLSIISLLVASFIAVFAFWRIQILTEDVEINRLRLEVAEESLEKKINLVMTVIPYCVWIVGGTYPNGTVKTRASTLALSRTESFSFKIYVSNIGDVFAHLIYYAVFFSCDSPLNYTEIQIPLTETIVLKPYESKIFEYLFEPSRSPPEVISTAHCFNLTFALGSVETTIQKVVLAQFED